MSKTRMAEINSKGLYNGWHAQQLQNKAIKLNKTMADCFANSIKNIMAFSVPGKVTKINSKWIHYTFLDNSTIRIQNEH